MASKNSQDALQLDGEDEFNTVLDTTSKIYLSGVVRGLEGASLGCRFSS